MAFIILTPAGNKEYAGRHRDFEDDLKKFAKTRLPGFACPEWVSILDELPVSLMLYELTYLNGLGQKTSTGKIMKTALRAYLAKL